jgi:hypothetical protein
LLVGCVVFWATAGAAARLNAVAATATVLRIMV